MSKCIRFESWQEVMTLRRSIFALGLVITFAGAAVYGQTTLGIIAGTVTDNSGAALSGATVTVQRSDGGESKTVKTGATGEYRLESLTPGTYSVKVSAQNFATAAAHIFAKTIV